MNKPKVYFTNMRCKVGTSLLDKMERLMTSAGIDQIDFNNKFTAIKLHFGEPGNLSFLRPNFAKVVADKVKALKGMPFLTDCNTLYVGRRNNALVHLDAAYENGFSPMSTGCQIIIGDGLRGADEVDVPVQGGVVLRSAKIGRAIMAADVFISLTHFKGHELTGFGGAIKNIGMGSGSRAGKMEMHSDGKPTVTTERCVGCRTCAKFCDHKAISFDESKKAHINFELCVGCGRCISSCNFHAIANDSWAAAAKVNQKMVEYTKAVLDGRPHFHISVAAQISPNCDCHGENDTAVTPDIGIFASFDPVALDQSCIDAVNAAPALPGSMLTDTGHPINAHSPADHFSLIHPDSEWKSQISHAELIGLGSSGYELITMP